MSNFMSKSRSFLVFLAASFLLSSCGDTRTMGPSYLDSTAGSSLPGLVVFVYSDLSSNFSQALGPSETGGGYYFTDTPNNLKNCALFQNQVETVSGYHSGVATETNCTNLGASFNSESLFPASNEVFARTEAAVSISSTGFVYAYFFYYPNATGVGGSDIDANQVVPSNNRCFKLWAAQVVDAQLVNRNGTPATTVDLKVLKCYGF